AKQEMAQVQAAMIAEDEEAEAENTTADLEEIAKAIRAYEATHRMLPNNTYDDMGRPLLSWRVHTLPFLGDDEAIALYKQFNLKEPWDSPNNLPLVDQIPVRYRASDGIQTKRLTYYRGFSHAGAVFEKPPRGKQPRQIDLADGIPDGVSNTI